jgi:hypothetical protein
MLLRTRQALASAAETGPVNVLFGCVTLAFTYKVASGVFCIAAFSPPPPPRLQGCLAAAVNQSKC